MILQNKKNIKRNKLLLSNGPRMSLNDFIQLKDLAMIIKENKAQLSPELRSYDAQFIENMTLLTNTIIQDIFEKYNEEGIFKLNLLVMSHNKYEFKHFLEYLKSDLYFSALHSKDEPLMIDNNILCACEDIDQFNTNFLQTLMARKLYNPGRHDGYLVYGIGGPRILVSHPFQGMNSELEIYDIYRNTLDVVSSLNIRGYYGSFLFLDYHGGLNYKINNIPAWALFFSYLANLSDVVIYIKEYDGEFRESQQLEIDFTSDKVQKKIVEIPHHELTWAKIAKTEATSQIYIGRDGKEISKEEFENQGSSLAKQLIKNYSEYTFPKDRIIVMDDNDNITEYPTSYQFY